jgi:hypothetical protein
MKRSTRQHTSRSGPCLIDASAERRHRGGGSLGHNRCHEDPDSTLNCQSPGDLDSWDEDEVLSFNKAKREHGRVMERCRMLPGKQHS